MYNRVIILVLSIVSFINVSADKSQIEVGDTNHSWISMENFASMIEVSLNQSTCTNVFFSGSSVGMENLFNEFARIYPYEYTVNRRTYICDGYFMISTSADILVQAMIRVPTTISTTELLVVIDAEVPASASVFNVSMYGNANVNIVAQNGLWSLSENYLAPRRFNKVTRYRDMLHKRGIVDLQGRRLQAAAFYIPPWSYLWTTVNRTVNGVVGQFYVIDNQAELDGVEVKLFLLIAERLNFTWTIRKPDNNYRYGRRNGTEWTGGMIGQLFRKEVDIAFSGIFIERDHYLFANLTVPAFYVNIRFLVPRPKPSSSFWALTRPLSPEVWAAVIAMVVIQSLYVYTRAWINPRLPKRFRSFAATWTELMGRLIGVCTTRQFQGLELQFQLWHVIGVLVVTAYSSSLAASLTSSDYEERIDTAEQLVRKNLTWGREGPVPKFSEYFGEVDPWARKLALQFQHETSSAERHAKILKGNYAIFGRAVGSSFFSENYISDEDLKGYRLMRDIMSEFYVSFAVQPWLLNAVNRVMLQLLESGIAEYHLKDVVHRHTSSVFREVHVEHDGIEQGARELQITPLGAGFSMLVLGLLISTIIFYHELKSASSSNKSIFDVLREIKKNQQLRDAKKVKIQRVKCLWKLSRRNDAISRNIVTSINGRKVLESKFSSPRKIKHVRIY